MFFFPSSHVWMGELDYNQGWASKNWSFWTVVLESPLDGKEIKPVNLKGNQSWIFIGRIDVEAETSIFWPLDLKNWLIGKDSDAGKYWRQEKRTTEDKMVGWHHWLDGHEFEKAPVVGDRQGTLACYNSGSLKELGMTGRLNSTELNRVICWNCQSKNVICFLSMLFFRTTFIRFV